LSVHAPLARTSPGRLRATGSSPDASQLFPWPARRSLPTGEFADKLRFNGGGDDVSPLRRLALRDASGLGPSGQAVGAHSSSAGLVSTRLRVLDLPLVGRPPDPRLETRLDSEARNAKWPDRLCLLQAAGRQTHRLIRGGARSPQLFATTIASGLDLEGVGSPTRTLGLLQRARFHTIVRPRASGQSLGTWLVL
jgi:hypothetical protein